MMFKALAALLTSAPTLILTFARVDSDRYRFTITPHRPKGKDDDDDDDALPEGTPGAEALKRPLQIIGTLDELDVDLPGELERYAQTRTEMKQVFADMAEELAKAKKEAAEAIAEEKKRANKGVPTVTLPPPAPVKPKAPVSIL